MGDGSQNADPAVRTKLGEDDRTEGVKARRGERDQAYAPFGAGRETGHQEPVVAAKIERDR